MNTSFERTATTTDEWYTPQWIIESLGEFDLDPCSPVNRLWDTAKNHYTVEDDGLRHNWNGRIWLNPPYSRPLIEQFLKRMVAHNNGIALIFNRCDSRMFHELIFPNATAVMFLQGRIKFFRPDGKQGGSPGCGSVLIAFGESNAKALENSQIPGKLIYINNA